MLDKGAKVVITSTEIAPCWQHRIGTITKTMHPQMSPYTHEIDVDGVKLVMKQEEFEPLKISRK